MAIEFRLPELGENIESGDVVAVLVREGDEVQAEQAIVEIETDKATVDVPCPHAGRVTQIHVKVGDTVPVGALLITLEASTAKTSDGAPRPATSAKQPKVKPRKSVPADPLASDESDDPAPRTTNRPSANQTEPAPIMTKTSAATAEPRTAPPAKPSTAPQQPSKSGNGARTAIAAGPATRRLARELGVDLSGVRGSGPAGRITREDVTAAVRAAHVAAPPADAPAATATHAPKATPRPGTPGSDPWGPIRREPMTKIRKTIAANMARSHSTIPHITNFDDADVTELERLRKASAADYAPAHLKLTMLPFVMKAVAQSLKVHPLLAASLDLDAGEIVYKDYANLGVAVDTDRGLVVPVIRDVDRLSIPQIAQALAALADQARANRFSIEDLRGGTFTVSNLGAVGGTYSTPIINYPEVAVLLVGRSRKLPVVIDERIEPRLMMPLSLSYDHRLIDGAVAARFLNDVIAYLEAPSRLLLAP